MGILPDSFSFGLEAFDSKWLDPAMSWLAGAQRPGFPPSPWSSFPALPAGDAATTSATPPAPDALPSPPPPGLSLPIPANPITSIGETLARIRAGIPQGLADNANTLLAFGGGALRGGVGQGASDAARVGLSESELRERRKALGAQQAATIAALRNAGLKNPESVAAIHPALARVLLGYLQRS
jgi:hypothetical protein